MIMNLKKHHLLAFPSIESHLSVVRPSRLLWEIDMIIRTLAKTNFMSWEATENFLEGPEVILVTNRVTLPYFPLASEFKKRVFSSNENDFGALQKNSVAFHDMKFVFASFLTIISISQSKRDGRTTLR